MPPAGRTPLLRRGTGTRRLSRPSVIRISFITSPLWPDKTGISRRPEPPRPVAENHRSRPPRSARRRRTVPRRNVRQRKNPERDGGQRPETTENRGRRRTDPLYGQHQRQIGYQSGIRANKIRWTAADQSEWIRNFFTNRFPAKIIVAESRMKNTILSPFIRCTHDLLTPTM